MNITPASIPEVKLIEPDVFADERGLFFESFNPRLSAALGVASPFVQDNHSQSRKNVLRGLHYQTEHTQGKLVRVVAGAVFDVAVDLRRSSRTFGQWTSATLSAENRMMMWVPEGFAHGYLALSDTAELVYKTTDVYHPQSERTIVWNDAEIGIEWPLRGESPILSSKDAAGLRLREAPVFP